MTTTTDGVKLMIENLKKKLEPAKESYWDTDITVEEVPEADPIDVFLSPVVMAKIRALMDYYANIEWLAYLIGEEKDGVRVISDLVIPKQVVTPVRVDVTGSVDVSTCGVIHSHHGMMNEFSHTDDEYINQNHGMSLCVARNGIQGVVRVKTSDTEYYLTKAKVVTDTFGVDCDVFIEEAKGLITEERFHPPTTSGDYEIASSEFFPEPTILECVDDYRVMLSEKDDISSVYSEMGMLYAIINNFISDDTSDEYNDAVVNYYDAEDEGYTPESVDLVECIDTTFYKELVKGEKDSLNNLQIFIEKVMEV